jgi:hypothetical protein
MYYTRQRREIPADGRSLEIPGHRWKINIKIGLKQDVKVCTGLKWYGTVSSSGLL